MTELDKLEQKRDEIMDELEILKPLQVKKPHLIKRIIQLSKMYSDCLQMIAVARANAVNNKQTTK